MKLKLLGLILALTAVFTFVIIWYNTSHWLKRQSILDRSDYGVHINSIAIGNDKIYVAGFDGSLGALWTDGKAGYFDLYQAEAIDMAVSGGDVYIAGRYVDVFMDRAFLLKNGVKQSLPLMGNKSYARSVAIFENDVYLAGYYNDEKDGVARPFLLKNGVGQKLPNIIKDSYADYVAVSDGDVYLSGSYYWIGEADFLNSNKFLLKNGENLQFFLNHKRLNILDFALSGKDVYVIAYSCEKRFSCEYRLLKNGKPIFIFPWRFMETASVSISGEDIYIIGRRITKYGWRIFVLKNGIEQPIPEIKSPARINAAAVFGKNVYIAGNYDVEDGYQTFFLKNGRKQYIPISGGRNVVINKIAVSDADIYAAGYSYDKYDDSKAFLIKNGEVVPMQNLTLNKLFLKIKFLF